jgi:glycosyltransferase involved in cell wall biosynthesis
MPNRTNARKKLLFAGPCKRNCRTFIQSDRDLLKQEFDVRGVNVCLDARDVKGALASTRRLIAGIVWTDVIFCWFASREAFAATVLSQLYDKKIVVVVGGADITTLPEIEYGAALDPTTRLFSTYVLNKATKLLPYSKDAEKRVLERLNDTTKTELVYLGIDVNLFKPSATKRKNRVMTVGDVKRSNLTRKGLETFVKAAAYLPDAEFFLIGQILDDSVDYLRSIASKNVTITDALPKSELIRCYQEANVYVQVSAHEAFGVAVAEAMACECVPLVTRNGSLPEVVGDTGVYVPYGDPAATAEGITQALESDKGRMARQRIVKMFTIGRRQEALEKTITGLLD